MFQEKNFTMTAEPPADTSRCSIEAMPDAILEHILSFLPPPESVRTCVLARRWRHLWRFATGLRVGGFFSVKERWEIMDHMLLGGESRLDTCEISLGEFEHEDVPQVNHWLRHAMMRKVRVFSLSVLPPVEIGYLELHDQPLASQYLRRLDLSFVQARNSFLNFSSCPSLEILVLEYCDFSSATKISSKSLKYLAIVSCTITTSASEHSRLRIHAPHLVSLSIDDPRGRTPVLDSMPSLVKAYVQICGDDCEDTCDKLRDPNCSQCGCEYCTNSDNVSVLLKGLSEAEDLELISNTEMFIFKMELRQCPTFSNLTTLFLNEYWCMPDDFTPLACILEHSPILEKLILELFCEARRYEEKFVGMFGVERPTTISEHLNIVEVMCQDVDKRVLKVLKFLSTFNIWFRF